MRLHVLNSGSRANGYILYNDREALVIECGCTYAQCLKALGFKREKIVGAIVTHEHGDHAKYVAQYLAAAIPVYASEGTIKGFVLGKQQRKAHAISSDVLFRVGDFSIYPFRTEHDSNEPFGYLIHHPEMGNCVFATDTYYLKYTFANLSQVMLECNYDNGILDKNVADGIVPPIVRDRVYKSHMSLNTNIETLKANDLSQVVNIVLLHLSGHNSDSAMFTKAVEEETGKLVYAAKKGLDIPFNKELL